MFYSRDVLGLGLFWGLGWVEAWDVLYLGRFVGWDCFGKDSEYS